MLIILVSLCGLETIRSLGVNPGTLIFDLKHGHGNGVSRQIEIFDR